MELKRLFALLFVCSSLVASAAVFEHAVYDAVPLDGAWEMAYLPYAYETVDAPQFRGVTVERAVPGYWEDMVPAFRAAGMTDEFRPNPFFRVQEFPITGYADDTTVPGIRGSFHYRRTVNLDRTGPAVLRFEGVRNSVRVWVNGRFAGVHAGFSTPFEMGIPADALRTGENEIVLSVSNDPIPGYADYVSGLTTRAVFRSTGGVNGSVELRLLKSDLADAYVTTAKDLRSFTVHVSGKDRFSYEIADGEKTLAKGETSGNFSLSTEGYEFWSPENPKRYDLRLTTEKGSYRAKFGIRRLTAKGEKFLLNGRPIYLRGVTEHCYFPKTVHLPRDIGYYRMITAKRKELGFNFVRFHTFIPPVEYLEAMDELGMVAHIESPNFVTVAEYAEIVAFARTHPSAVIYCTGNETRIDRMAEAYLENVADLVHSRTDALFSPMSAMRGVEYYLMPGKDVIVREPFPHNPERMARLGTYCDMFTSYQLGLTSYESLNSEGPEALDAWGACYCGKPRTSHEICIDGSYVDLSLEKMYPPDSPILKAGIFSGLRRQLTDRGLIDRADTYFRNSCEWMRRIRKFTFEKLRAADRVAGYDFLGDINTHWHTYGYSVGMMDEFYRLKPGETVENVRRYNSAAVLLCDLGSDFNVTAGEKKSITFSLSNYDRKMTRPELRADLVNESGEVVSGGCAELLDVPNGKVSVLKTIGYRIPESDVPRKYLLRAKLSDGTLTVANEWEVYAFPKGNGEAASSPLQQKGNLRVVTDITEQDLQAAMERGERVLLLGTGPFKSLPTTYRIGMAGRCAGNFATVVKAGHPALEGLPHEGFCGWQFRRLMEGGAAVQLEADVPFDPIVEIVSAAKCVIRQAGLFEYRIEKGRLLVCSFNFAESDPAARWLKDRLVAYAASDAFNPAQSLTSDQLHTVVSAPLLSGAADSNRARNPNDPSSAVRADALALP